MFKVPIDINEEEELREYLDRKCIDIDDKVIKLIRRYGITETINPIKNLICKGLNSEWNHVYERTMQGEDVYEYYTNSKEMNRKLFCALDEFERLFTFQIMNIYLQNSSKIDLIIDKDVKNKIADEKLNDFIETFMSNVSDIHEVEINSNFVFSFFNNSINASNASLNKKIQLFKILKLEYKKNIIVQINDNGNFKLSTDSEKLQQTIELNALNQLRNLVCHGNSLMYKCSESSLKTIYSRIYNVISDEKIKESKKIIKMQKSIKNIRYCNSLIHKGIKSLNRNKINNLEEKLKLEKIYEKNVSLYNNVLYKETELSENVYDQLCSIETKMKRKRENYIKKNHTAQIDCDIIEV